MIRRLFADIMELLCVMPPESMQCEQSFSRNKFSRFRCLKWKGHSGECLTGIGCFNTNTEV